MSEEMEGLLLVHTPSGDEGLLLLSKDRPEFSVHFVDPTIEKVVQKFLTTKREFKIPTGDGIDEYRVEMAVPTTSLDHLHSALNELFADTDIFVHWTLDYEESGQEAEKSLGETGLGDEWSIDFLTKAAVKPKSCTDYVRIGDEWVRQGKFVSGDDLERLKDMNVPPAWREVVVATDPNAKIQAIGMDEAGRWQYRYSAAHIQAADRKKFTRLKSFQRDMPGIREGMNRDLRAGDPRAMLLAIEDKTAIRIGSAKDFRAKQKAYGLTTLQHEHVAVKGNKIKFAFTGKEGIPVQYDLVDSRIAPWLAHRKSITAAGQPLFPDVSSPQLNSYLKQLAGGKHYTIKDFRTYHGTRVAFEELQKYSGQTLTVAQRSKIVTDVSAKAGAFLRNSPAAARGAYIDPMVWETIGGIPKKVPAVASAAIVRNGGSAQDMLKTKMFKDLQKSSFFQLTQHPLWKDVSWSSDGGLNDRILERIAQLRGYTGKPTLLSKKAFAAAEGLQLQRGVTGRRGMPADKFAKQFKTGKYFGGKGVYGNGTYTAYGQGMESTARSYAGIDGAVINMKMKSGARVVNSEELYRMREEFFNEASGANKAKALWEKMMDMPKDQARGVYLSQYKIMDQQADELKRKLSTALNDKGRFAAFMGYDAIDVSGARFMVVLNRTALFVEK